MVGQRCSSAMLTLQLRPRHQVASVVSLRSVRTRSRIHRARHRFGSLRPRGLGLFPGCRFPRSDASRDGPADIAAPIARQGGAVSSGGLHCVRPIRRAGFWHRTEIRARGRWEGGIGDPMSEFQLDASDCDGIVEQTTALRVPVFLMHAQIRSRPTPPTFEFVPTGMWWVPVRDMLPNLRDVRNRPRETRPAAYYRTSMFRPISDFPRDITPDWLRSETERIRSGDIPVLYTLGVTGPR